MKTPGEESKPSGVPKPEETKKGSQPKILFPQDVSPRGDSRQVDARVPGKVEPKVLSFVRKPASTEEGTQALTPKVLFSSGKQASQATPQPGAPPAVTPKVVLHDPTIRRRLTVTEYELRSTLGALSEQETIRKALEQIRVTNLDDGRDDKFVNWGVPSQRTLSQLLDQEMHLVQSPALVSSRQEMADMFAILKRITVPQQRPLSRAGMLARIAEKVRKTDLPSNFDVEYAKLQLVTSHLEARLPELRALGEAARKLVEDTKALEGDVEATIIAGRYLVYCVRSGRYSGDGLSVRLEEQMKILDQRVESLSSTAATLKMNVVQREFLVATITHLVDCVQNTLLVDIPAWRTNYMCVLAAVSAGNEPDGSVFTELISKQQQILERIQV